MTSREKVIKGLECCSHEEIGDCGNCPYNSSDMHCDIKMMRDALELLKAQKPRVMTLEEATSDGECWLEHINGVWGYADCYLCTGPQDVEAWMCMRQEPDYLKWTDYGKTWRCWNVRPTDAQREATPWQPQ